MLNVYFTVNLKGIDLASDTFTLVIALMQISSVKVKDFVVNSMLTLDQGASFGWDGMGAGGAH